MAQSWISKRIKLDGVPEPRGKNTKKTGRAQSVTCVKVSADVAFAETYEDLQGPKKLIGFVGTHGWATIASNAGPTDMKEFGNSAGVAAAIMSFIDNLLRPFATACLGS